VDNDSKTDRRVARVLHAAHLRFQQAALRPETVTLPCPEQRDTRFRYQPKQWLLAQRSAQLVAVLTGVRPNFWKAYMDTIVYMSK
jgi:hypothetical protein